MDEEYYITIDMIDYTCITKAIFVESIDKKSSVYYLPETRMVLEWNSSSLCMRQVCTGIFTRLSFHAY